MMGHGAIFLCVLLIHVAMVYPKCITGMMAQSMSSGRWPRTKTRT
jgi:hypothetical protein